MDAKAKLSLLGLLLTLTSYSFSTFARAEGALFGSIREANEVKVALASVAPYITLSPSGEVTGPSVDLQNMVLKGMGLKALTPILTGWDAMIPGLQAHQFDYIGAGITISDERCKAVLFSTPHYAAHAGLFVLRGNPKHLTSVADIARRPEIKLATGRSLDEYRVYALKQGVKPEQIIPVPDIQAGAAMVIGGRADAYIVGQFTIPNPEERGLEVVVDKQSPVYASAVAFRKEDMKFREAFNEQLLVLIKNGTIQKLYEKYGIPNGDKLAKLLANFTKAKDIVPSCD
ncbi:transporter substrate-binding domain-containing protein [Bradyrhizobium cenepequi]|uniref:transporter substrate-binding domain-containing protein n=1 Tax=Bradyrhizobium cenepequi TaxID=2821403 RepID=UPI001CE29811|nr:transporter substrate-binding domain-containing protein [Bradyrhizobium cenepequi]MCA6112198.1 transporter substrate-binding domain-containing protein [Bradyrhizobium cenepequi]